MIMDNCLWCQKGIYSYDGDTWLHRESEAIKCQGTTSLAYPDRSTK